MRKLDGGALLARKTWDAGNSQKRKTNVLGKHREEEYGSCAKTPNYPHIILKSKGNLVFLQTNHMRVCKTRYAACKHAEDRSDFNTCRTEQPRATTLREPPLLTT
ncbi:hypothetical protein A2U01_0015950 [Trifolium medium]|uniref:Uncharacterized protein n=1 Tax=Trifolium medium TaxID=97028 RepID=A0A392N7J6_9FABA|nr:hypothetical protein [Trifolium medium]